MTRRHFIIDFYPCGCSLATGAAVWFRLVGGGVWVGTAVGVPVGAGVRVGVCVGAGVAVGSFRASSYI